MSTSYASLLVQALHEQDKSRPRSKQTKVGPSSIGGCRRKVWSQINGVEPVNPDTLRLAAVMGTAIHSVAEQAMHRIDPWGERFELEVEVEYDGLTGHVDVYAHLDEDVVDWKTTTKKGLASFPSKQQRWQVQVYAHMLTQAGRNVKRVVLVGIPRDGNENDIVEYAEDYDPVVAEEALAWLADVESRTGPPAPEKDPVSFCSNYCEFYGPGGCLGKLAGGEAEAEPLPESEAELVRAYAEAKAKAEAAAAVVEGMRVTLEGIAGVTSDGWAVAWSSRSSSTVDRDAIRKALGEVPMKQGRESTVLTVKKVA